MLWRIKTIRNSQLRESDRDLAEASKRAACGGRGIKPLNFVKVEFYRFPTISIFCI